MMSEEFDRLSGMTFAVVFYSNENVFVPRSNISKYQNHAVDNFFFNLRFFSAYLVYIDSPKKGQE